MIIVNGPWTLLQKVIRITNCTSLQMLLYVVAYVAITFEKRNSLYYLVPNTYVLILCNLVT